MKNFLENAIIIILMFSVSHCKKYGSQELREKSAIAKFIPIENTNLRLQDVSILFPVEKNANDLLLKADNAGSLGVLLSENSYNTLPPLVEGHNNSRAQLRVVGVRIDPCFPAVGGNTCLKQLRLVMQPVNEDGAIDCAVHIFYEQTTEQFAKLIVEMKTLRRVMGGDAVAGPIGVHPDLKQQGMNGRFAVELKRIILAHAGEQNMTKVTYMNVGSRFNSWRFGGFDVSGGKLMPFKIKGLTVVEQRFINGSFPNETGVTPLHGIVEPLTTADVNINALLSVTQDNPALAAIEPAIIETLRLENPLIHSPETTDCVSCHVAMAARMHTEIVRGLEPSTASERYQSIHDLSLLEDSKVNFKSLHAFGYIGVKPFISQRTLNETAEVLDSIL